ncbi:MAG TPA: DUF2459 domain-containing protein [Steroidobacteraceae bacterium]|nr:DUF2459 domain-containing protein [Steroidobacteraceae bacterium]
MILRAGIAAEVLSAGILCGIGLLAACASAPTGSAPPVGSSVPGGSMPADPAPITLYVVRRSWHVDVGFAAADLQASLGPVAQPFPRAKYLLFGFGDRHYLLAGKQGAPSLLRALWPGPGLMLVTALEGSPQSAFGAAHVLELHLTQEQSRGAQKFIAQSFAKLRDQNALPSLEGPYPGSRYFDAAPRYSGVYTCNTWAADALRAAGLPVRSRFTWLAGQLWRQVIKLAARPVVASIAGWRIAVLADGGRAASLGNHDGGLGGRRRARAADAAG